MNPYKIAAICALSTSLIACSSSDSNDPQADDTSVDLQFVAEVNDAAFSCGSTYSGVGIGVNNQMKLTDLRFYLHDLRFKRADGSYDAVTLDQDGAWQVDDVALLDFENGCSNGSAEMNTSVRGTAPANTADYVGICFKLGLPFDKNHIDDATAVPPLNISSMLWTWTSGRKFLRVDGLGDPDNLAVPYHVHLGSTGCVDTGGDPAPDSVCANPNVAEICLDMNPATQQVSVDVGSLLGASDITAATPNPAPGCMSHNTDPQCIEVLPRLGLPFTHNDGVNPATVYPAQAQQLFSVDN